MDYKNYILDFESTVADLSKVYSEAFSSVFKEFNIPFDPSKLDEYVSTPMDVLFGRFYKGCTCKYRDFVIMFMGEFDKNFGLAEPRRGVIDKLTLLHEDGSSIGIVSGVAEMYVDRFLTENGIRNIFRSVVGVERVAVPRTEPYAIRLCMKELNASDNDTMIVSSANCDRSVSEKTGILIQTEL